MLSEATESSRQFPVEGKVGENDGGRRKWGTVEKRERERERERERGETENAIYV